MRKDDIIEFTEKLGNIYFKSDENGNLVYLSSIFEDWVGLRRLRTDEKMGVDEHNITHKFDQNQVLRPGLKYSDFIYLKDRKLVEKAFLEALQNHSSYEVSYRILTDQQETVRVLEKGFFSKSLEEGVYCSGTIQKINSFSKGSEVEHLKNDIRALKKQQKNIQKIFSDLSVMDEFDGDFNPICKNIYESSSFNRILISTFDGGGEQRHILGSHGYEKEELEQIQELDLDRNFFEEVLNKGNQISRLSCSFPGELSVFLGESWKGRKGKKKTPQVEEWRAEDILFIKIVNKKGALLGLIMAYHPQENYLSSGVIGYLESISGLLSQIIVNRKYRFKADNAKAQLQVTNQNLISANQQLEKAIFQSSEMTVKAREAAKVKSQFLANMSHEIRTPMNAILGFSKLLESTPLSSDQKESLLKIQLSSSSLLRIINDILDFSKIEAGKMELEHNRFHLYNVTDYISDMFSKKASDKLVELVIAVDQQVPKILTGDQLRIRQILVNLVNNALKFTPEGTVVLGVRVGTIDKKNVEIKFTVTDTGSGIPVEKIDSLFEPFSQVDGSTTRKYGGTGLGLSICYQLVNLMGGEISVKSKPGKGSVFSFHIPMKYDPIKDGKEIIPDLIVGARLAVIDNSTFFSKTIKKYLTYFGFKVETFRKFSHFQKHAKLNGKSRFKLVILERESLEDKGAKQGQANRLMLASLKVPVLMTTQLFNHYRRDRSESSNIITLNKPLKYSAFLKSVLQLLGYGNGVKKEKDIAEKISNVKAFLKETTVLLVEDNYINQQVVGDILRKVGVHVVLAENGQEALNCISKNVFDIVLMDIQMPIMDGYEATRNIRKVMGLKDLPVIAMTAFAMKGDREKCLTAGMTDYITKPIDIDKFYRTLLKWVPHKRGQKLPEKKQPPETKSAFLIEKLKHQLPEIDVQAAVLRFQGNDSLFLKLLKEFSHMYASSFEDIKKAIEDGSEEDAYKILHTLKGISGNFSADKLYESIVGFSKAIKDPKIKNYEAHFISFQNELNKVINSVRRVDIRSEGNLFSSTKLAKEGIEPFSQGLITFCRLLAENDMEAEQYFQIIKSDIFSLLGDAKGKRVERLINNFDFDSVKHILTESITNLEFSF